VGQALLPAGKQVGLHGPFESPMQWFADIIWESLCRVSDCDWPDWFFFDTRGPRVGGLVLWTFDDQKNSARNVTGTKLAAGEEFDVVSPSIAFAYDDLGFANRYWLFGGEDALARPSDEMWGARRAYQDGGGGKVYADLAGSPNLPSGSNDGVLAGPEVYFELARVPQAGSWPAARTGAVLLCTGFGFVGGQTCQKVCPRVDLALSGYDATGASTNDPGALLLVGGEGSSGLLDDIWMYSGPSAWNAAGWRQVGRLPEATGGLASPGVVQVGRAVWLVGGRTNAGVSNDIWRLAADTGVAERIVTSGVAPAGRVSPAVTYDATTNRILVFGGTDVAAQGINDVWAFDTDAQAWSRLAAGCDDIGCPAATGREGLHFNEATGEVTVVVDRNGPDADVVAWTLHEGIWRTRLEEMTPPTDTDCDSDGEAERLANVRCGTGTDGFPDYGRMGCVGGTLACRSPAAPGQIVGEYEIGGVRTIVARDKDIFVLRGANVEAYRVGNDGALTGLRTIRLSRAAHDLALYDEFLLAADGRGLAVYRLEDGVEVSRIDTCGKARRVFAFAAGAVVVGLRSVLLIDLGDPTTPGVIADLRLWPTAGGLAVTTERRCSKIVTALERLWDALSPAGGSGRDVAAFDAGRLFLNLLGSIYVLDFRGSATPVVSEGVPIGLVRDLRVEDAFLYANTAWDDGIVFAETEPGSWSEVGTHDVGRWVAGTTDVGGFTLAWGHGRLSVARRQ
jgi:hypothetical protein